MPNMSKANNAEKLRRQSWAKSIGNFAVKHGYIWKKKLFTSKSGSVYMCLKEDDTLQQLRVRISDHESPAACNAHVTFFTPLITDTAMHYIRSWLVYRLIEPAAPIPEVGSWEKCMKALRKMKGVTG